jgi:hypothetical protein
LALPEERLLRLLGWLQVYWYWICAAFVWATAGYRCAQLGLFFFLLLLERAELHEGYLDEQALVFGGFVLDVCFGEYLQATQQALGFYVVGLLHKTLLNGIWRLK